MSTIPWIAAEAERPEDSVKFSHVSQRRRDPSARCACSGQAPSAGWACSGQGPSTALRAGVRRPQHPELRGTVQVHPGFDPQELPAHQFPARAAQEERATAPAEDPEREQEQRVYRGRTVTMLRRYMRYAIETGRLPSLLGREFFRAKVTRYTVVTFEDRVIFVHDMEMCLARLDEFSRRVLSRVVLQEYDQEEAAHLLGCTRMTVHRKLVEALDRLKDILLEVGLLESVRPGEKNSCQEGERGDFFVSDCEEAK